MTRTAYRILEEGQGQRERVKGMMLFRFVIIFFFLAAMVVPTHREMFSSSQPPIYTLLLALCALNCLYYLAFRRVQNVRAFAALQLAVDVVAETFIIYLSGGLSSNFIFLYFTSILGASVLLSARSSVVFASTATTMLAGISLLDFAAHSYDWALPLLDERAPARSSTDLLPLFYILVVHALAFYLVALLSGASRAA